MNTIGKFFIAGAIALAAVSCNNAETVKASDAVEVQEVTAEAVTYAIGGDQTLTWEGHKPFVENYGHYGTIKITEGNLSVKESSIEGGSFVIDMSSIVAEDMIGNENYDKLVGHLMSDDFFAVETYPTSKFEITNVEANANDELGTTHKISGNLTMRDQTKNITFDANVSMTENSITLAAPGFKIDRKNWNVMFGSTGIEGLAKDKLIADDITLKFEISATKS